MKIQMKIQMYSLCNQKLEKTKFEKISVLEMEGNSL